MENFPFKALREKEIYFSSFEIIGNVPLSLTFQEKNLGNFDFLM